jgi:SAM-dependent methyltransferase
MGFAAAAPLLALASSHSSLGVIRKQFPVESWSPYYRINYAPDSRAIAVNLLGHQSMVSRRDPYPAYAIPYLLNRDSSQPPFHSVLIIGAGSGNDVSRALEWAAPDAHIDAVEIDPVIKNLGIANHPDHPYQDPRVTLHLNDGRNFLRSTNGKYDLIVFALIDSLVLHSSLSNLRLESYLFTEEALADVRRVLAPDGLFVMYNYFRQGWIVSRLAKTADTAFGHLPLVLTLPERDSIAANEKVEGFTLLFDGPRSAALRRAFDPTGAYRIGEIRLSPAKLEIPPDLRNATDAWPFLYLRSPMIPSLVWRGIAVMGAISVVMLWTAGFRSRRPLPDGRGSEQSVAEPRASASGSGAGSMLLLGAGFMLLETKAVVHMALIFGSTWIVNSVVFAAILVMILAANLRVLRRKSISLFPYYMGLLAALALNLAIPLDSFLGWPFAVRAVLSGALVLGPVFFAGIVFAALIRQSDKPEQALAWNTAGAILGGFAENASLWIGFQYLTAVAGLIYLASWWASRRETASAQRMRCVR